MRVYADWGWLAPDGDCTTILKLSAVSMGSNWATATGDGIKAC